MKKIHCIFQDVFMQIHTFVFSGTKNRCSDYDIPQSLCNKHTFISLITNFISFLSSIVPNIETYEFISRQSHLLEVISQSVPPHSLLSVTSQFQMLLCCSQAMVGRGIWPKSTLQHLQRWNSSIVSLIVGFCFAAPADMQESALAMSYACVDHCVLSQS